MYLPGQILVNRLFVKYLCLIQGYFGQPKIGIFGITTI